MNESAIINAIQELTTAVKNIGRDTGPKLGFHEANSAEYVFVGGTDDGSCWYRWDHDRNVAVSIPQAALTGMLSGIYTMTKNGARGESRKLRVTLTADRPYVLQAGLETVFSRMLLQQFATAAAGDYHSLASGSVVTVEVTAGDEGKVIFPTVLVDGARVKYDYDRDADCEALAETVIALLGFEPETEAGNGDSRQQAAPTNGGGRQPREARASAPSNAQRTQPQQAAGQDSRPPQKTIGPKGAAALVPFFERAGVPAGQRLNFAAVEVGREVTAMAQLTPDEGHAVVRKLKTWKQEAQRIREEKERVFNEPIRDDEGEPEIMEEDVPFDL